MPGRSYQISPIGPLSRPAALQGRRSSTPQGFGSARVHACSITISPQPYETAYGGVVFEPLRSESRAFDSDPAFTGHCDSQSAKPPAAKETFVCRVMLISASAAL